MKQLNRSFAAVLISSLLSGASASAASSIYLEGNVFDSDAMPISVSEFPNGQLPGANRPASVSMSYGKIGSVKTQAQSTLVPGFYTAIVRGADDTVGVALVEAYNLQ